MHCCFHIFVQMIVSSQLLKIILNAISGKNGICFYPVVNSHLLRTKKGLNHCWKKKICGDAIIKIFFTSIYLPTCYTCFSFYSYCCVSLFRFLSLFLFFCLSYRSLVSFPLLLSFCLCSLFYFVHNKLRSSFPVELFIR
jgi:hypothetical protein